MPTAAHLALTALAVAADGAPSAVELLAHPVAVKALTFLIACLLGCVAALAAGILTGRSQRLSVAIASGAGAFAATVLLCLAAFTYVLL